MSILPKILDPGSFNLSDVAELKQFASTVVDIYEHQLEELFRVEHPDRKIRFEEYRKGKEVGDLAGAWVYFSWNKTALHCVSKQELFALRTNRNKNLITEQEQKQLAAAKVGIAGMSVGAGIAVSAVYSGMSETIKIADFDTLDTSNLNRLRETLLEVGKSKTDLAAQHMYELDPFLTIQQFSTGLNEENLPEFFDTPKLDIVVDEIDDFKMKIKLRLAAKQRQIPLVMFTSLGDNILIDIERYDTEKDLQPFHGLLGNYLDEIISKETIEPEDIKHMSVRLVGAEYIPTRALDSVSEMGRTLVGRPQLYGTIAVDGGLSSYVLRKLILSVQPLSGRYFVKFSQLFNIADDDLTDNLERESVLKKLMS